MDIRDVGATPGTALHPDRSLTPNATKDIFGAILLAGMSWYLKPKNFHRHILGRHFRDYHLLLDERADQIFAATDDMAQRVRKIGGRTLRSIGQLSRVQHLPDTDADYVTPHQRTRGRICVSQQ
jgi:starvation-inducible DNA-binding protein